MATKVESKKGNTGFVQGVRSEMRKVSWPSRKELGNYTLVVITMCVSVAAVVGVMDAAFKFVITKL